MPEQQNDETDGERRVMRIAIAGAWTARDMVRMVRSLDSLYATRFVLEAVCDDWKRIARDLRRYEPYPWGPWYPGWREYVVSTTETIIHASRHLQRDEALSIVRLAYASPGVTDLAGVGKIVDRVLSFIEKMIEHWLSRKKREFENQKLEKENGLLDLQAEAQSAAIVRDYLAMMKDVGYPKIEQRKMLERTLTQVRPLKMLVERNQITGVKELPPGERSNAPVGPALDPDENG